MNYCGHLKSNHSKFGNIHNPHFLKIEFQMFRFSKVQAIAMVPTTIQIPDIFVDFKWFRKIGGHFSRFQIPFNIWTMCKPIFFRSLEIRTRPDFRSPLLFKLAHVPYCTGGSNSSMFPGFSQIQMEGSRRP